MKNVKRIIADTFGYKESNIGILDDVDTYEVLLEGGSDNDEEALQHINDVVDTLKEAGHEIESSYFEHDYFTTDYVYYIEIKK
jgi:hypothetical protein